MAGRGDDHVGLDRVGHLEGDMAAERDQRLHIVAVADLRDVAQRAAHAREAFAESVLHVGATAGLLDAARHDQQDAPRRRTGQVARHAPVLVVRQPGDQRLFRAPERAQQPPGRRDQPHVSAALPRRGEAHAPPPDIFCIHCRRAS
jgi:hypothetical protein